MAPQPPAATGPATPQVLESPAPGLHIMATGETWVRVSDANGNHLWESVMQAGDTYEVPQLEEPPVLRTGQSGAVYFCMNGQVYGPVGPRGSVTGNVPLQNQALAELYQPTTVLEPDSPLTTMVAALQQGAADGAQDERSRPTDGCALPAR